MNQLSPQVLPTRRRRVLLYSADGAFRKQAAERLEALAIYDVETFSAEEFAKLRDFDDSPSIVILDVGDGEMLADPAVAETRNALGPVPLIAVSGSVRPELMRQLVKLNAADWLQKPIDGKELVSAVTLQNSGSQSLKSRITAVIGASGGAGATTIALAAAEHLAGKSARRAEATCVVDLDFQRANCSGYLNLSKDIDLDSVVSRPDRLDLELLEVLKLTYKPGFSVFSFARPGMYYEPQGADFVYRLLDLTAYHYEDVIIDLPNLETPWQQSVLSTANNVIIVFELNIASLRQTKRLYSRLRELRGGSDGILLVANKRIRKLFGNHFSQRDLEKIFKIGSVKWVRNDTNVLSEALNRALMPSQVHPRAGFNKDIRKLFKQLFDSKAK